MKRIIITTVLLISTGLAAQAYPVAMYRDLIRPNGQPRSQDIYQSNLDACYRQTGQSRYKADGPAFKKCMRSRGYRFVWQRYAPNPPSYSGPSYDLGPTPDPTPPAVPDPNTFLPPPSRSAPVYDSNGLIVPGTGL